MRESLCGVFGCAQAGQMYTMLHLKTVVLSFLMAFDVLFPSPAHGVRISSKAHDVILTELPLLTNVHASQSCKTLNRLSRQVFFAPFASLPTGCFFLLLWFHGLPSQPVQNAKDEG